MSNLIDIIVNYSKLTEKEKNLFKSIINEEDTKQKLNVDILKELKKYSDNVVNPNPFFHKYSEHTDGKVF